MTEITHRVIVDGQQEICKIKIGVKDIFHVILLKFFIMIGISIGKIMNNILLRNRNG